MKNRMGETNVNTYGSLMEIVEYNGANDVWVKFANNNYLAHATYDQFKKMRIKNPYDKSLFGVGYLGEGKYKTTINKKCTPQYAAWKSMLMRCYDDTYRKSNPAYKDCNVIEEWLNFQNFAEWYDRNFYEFKEERMCLDKDILIKNNKTYSPDTCIYVPQSINNLFTKSNATRGQLPVGIAYNGYSNEKYYSCCSNKGKQIILGYFNSLTEAFESYKEYKEQLIKEIANEHKKEIPFKLYEALINYKVEIND